MEIVNVLWTGGLDSTCRIAELSKLEVQIQPYYILVDRNSRKYELRALRDLTSIIRTHKQTKAVLKDPIFVSLDSFVCDADIMDAWTFLNKKYELGSQYYSLAAFARNNNIDLEIGLEKSLKSKARTAILSESNLVNIDADKINYYRLEKDNSSKEIYTIFEHLNLPARIWNMTKMEEVEEMKELGLKDLISKTWFCHDPICGLTCGHCNPCKDAFDEEMSFRVSKIGYLLYYVRYILRIPGRCYNHFFRK